MGQEQAHFPLRHTWVRSGRPALQPTCFLLTKTVATSLPIRFSLNLLLGTHFTVGAASCHPFPSPQSRSPPGPPCRSLSHWEPRPWPQQAALKWGSLNQVTEGSGCPQVSKGVNSDALNPPALRRLTPRCHLSGCCQFYREGAFSGR